MFSWLRNIFVSKEDDMKKKLDVNNDGKVNLADAVEVVKKVEEKVEAVAAPVVETVAKAADVNKDGKVDKADVKAAATKVKATVKSKAMKAKAKK